MGILTLLTDFGEQDGFVGVMKGVILGIAPETQIADITHRIAVQDVHQAAFVIGRAALYFPPGTVHIAVVDPGVGTQRRAIAVRAGGSFFVGPDNGIFTRVFQTVEEQNAKLEVVALDQPQYWLQDISTVFHGRDIFAPIGAHLVNGVALEKLGAPILDALRLEFPQVEILPGLVRGQVAGMDYFGNLITNIERRHLSSGKVNRVTLCGAVIHEMVETFGSKQPGELAAMFGTHHDLTVAIVNGSAQQALGAKIGDAVEVWLEV